MNLQNLFTRAVATVGLSAMVGASAAPTTVPAVPVSDAEIAPISMAQGCMIAFQMARIALTQGALGPVDRPPASTQYADYSDRLTKYREKLLAASNALGPNRSYPNGEKVGNYSELVSDTITITNAYTSKDAKTGRVTFLGNQKKPISVAESYRSDIEFINRFCP